MKHACHIKRFVLPQNMKARSRQFVRERLTCDDRVGPGFLAFIETPGFRAIALGEVGGLDERPRQIPVAVAGVAFALLLAIADALAVDTARIGRKVPDTGETLERPGLKQNGCREYRPAYPLQAFDTLFAARAWVTGLVHWYNHEHRHSAIRFVTPAQRHAKLNQQILDRRATLYEAAKQRNPLRWKGPTRNWQRVHTVHLNPDQTDNSEHIRRPQQQEQKTA